MRFAPLAAAFLLAASIPSHAPAQSTPAPGRASERGVYLTAFRSPATGLEVRAGRLAGFAGFYPTVIARDGERANTNFVRAGATYYLRPRGTTPYVSPSVVWSLDGDWGNGALTEVGFRGPLVRRVNGRLGVALLTTVDGPARVNPTVGLDLRLGRGR